MFEVTPNLFSMSSDTCLSAGNAFNGLAFIVVHPYLYPGCGLQSKRASSMLSTALEWTNKFARGSFWAWIKQVLAKKFLTLAQFRRHGILFLLGEEIGKDL
jgi:hypothetical protein